MTYAIIYRIINCENKKSYIGKTKSHYGLTPYGIDGRFRQHKINAFINSRKNECPLLYNAIRKYGKDAFIIETLIECEMKDADLFEKIMIRTYDSANKNIGYNIALGGKGRSIVNTSESVRLKISQKQSNGIMNIKPVIRKGIHVGYKVRRRDNGKIYQKTFTSSTNSLAKNLELAHQSIEDIKKLKFENNPYNRKDDLPKGITYAKNRSGKIIGYKCHLMKKRKKYFKLFSNSDFSMEEKLKLASEWIEKLRLSLS